jgi:hypothetical protein
MPRLSVLFPVLTLLVVSSPAARAQPERYDLGQHLRAFERALDKNPAAAGRQRAVPYLQKATLAFFALQLGEAARGLDLARFALQTEKPDADQLWAESFASRPAARLLDRKDGKLELTLASLYTPQSKGPDNPLVSWLLTTPEGTAVAGPAPGKWMEKKGAVGKLEFKDVKEGDYLLQTEIREAGGEVLALSRQTVSLAAGLRPRLEALRQAVPKRPAGPATTDQATLSYLVGLLEELAQGRHWRRTIPGCVCCARRRNCWRR